MLLRRHRTEPKTRKRATPKEVEPTEPQEGAVEDGSGHEPSESTDTAPKAD